MTPDDYVNSILSRYTVNQAAAVAAGQAVYPIVKTWAGAQLAEGKFSGSHAKGTGIAGSVDTDIFISLKSDTTNTLKEIYDSLAQTMRNNGYAPKLQNVSIRVSHGGMQIDLVPGIKHSGNSNYHWLYVSRSGRERTQTNIDLHISEVTSSGRINEIRAIKIWAKNHGLDFPSIYLELSVIAALSGYRVGNTANNVLTVLEYLRDRFMNARIQDPANTANIISEDLTQAEKQAIATQARISKLKPTWGEIIW
jgi:hypothetical protein